MVKVPKFFIFIIVVFWGINIGSPIFALILGFFLEIPNLFRIDVNFKKRMFEIVTFFSFILLGIIVYFYIKTNPLYVVTGIIKWSPLIFFPIIIIQNYSENKKTPLKTLFFFIKTDKEVDLSWLYLGLTLLASASGEKLLSFYYIYSFLIVVIALFIVKPKKYSIFIWLIIVMILSVVAFGVESGVSILHKKAVDKAVDWLIGDNSNINLWKTNSAIGDIGRLKESNRIIYRIKEVKGVVPKYLRLATYLLYHNDDWFTDKDKFEEIKSNTICKKIDSKSKNGRFIISGDLNENDLLAIPAETLNMYQNGSTFYNNGFYSIKRNGNSGNSKIIVDFNRDQFCDKEIQKKDFKTPRLEHKAIDFIIEEAELKNIKDERELLNKLETFFQNNFSYSLKGSPKGNFKTSLSRFLLGDRKGHCEYFATATTLILRKLGFVARYTIGYSVQEYSKLENQYIVRSRHGHAWVRVQLKDKSWINFDTTPYGWSEIEEQDVSPFYIIYDFFSYLNYKFSQIGLWNIIKKNMIYILIFLIILFIFLKRKSYERVDKLSSEYPLPGSIIFKIDKILFKKGISRDKTIPFLTWLDNLEDKNAAIVNRKKLKIIIKKYYDLRFQNKLNDENLKELKIDIKKWKKNKS